MRIRATIAGLSLLAGLSACVLSVDFAKAGGPHCSFAGASTACGTCLADHCGATIDACCFDDECGGVIADVESCATQSGAACTHLGDPKDRDGLHADLTACFAKECASACPGDTDAAPPAHNLTQCHPAYVTSVDACECELDSPANDTPCTEVGHPDLHCCAADGWPGPARTCECLPIACYSAGAGCGCELSPMDDQNLPTQCTGAVCCFDPMLNSCDCGTVPCSAQETKVASCTIAALGCGAGLHHVASCAVPKP